MSEPTDIETPENDPEIAALLDFEPVPRKRVVEGGWTPELQRAFIVRLAAHGSAGRACDEMGKNLTGMTKIYRSPLAKSFRDAWHGAVDLAKRRKAERERQEYVSPGTMPPSIDNRRKHPRAEEGEEGEVRNEDGEWEDEVSYRQRAEEAGDRIRNRLLRIRRLYLQQIAGSPGKRAAFEILTELPVDWDKARRGEAQPDEPYNIANQRQPDMILTAESGWSFGELGYGRDRKAQMRRTIDEHRAEQGLPAIRWGAD